MSLLKNSTATTAINNLVSVQPSTSTQANISQIITKPLTNDREYRQLCADFDTITTMSKANSSYTSGYITTRCVFATAGHIFLLLRRKSHLQVSTREIFPILECVPQWKVPRRRCSGGSKGRPAKGHQLANILQREQRHIVRRVLFNCVRKAA